MKNLVAFLAAVMLLTGGTRAHAELVDKVAAVVNRDVIAMSEAQQRAAPEMQRLNSEPDPRKRAD